MAWRWNIDRGRGLEGAAVATCAVLAAAALWLAIQLAWLLLPRGDAALGGDAIRVGTPAAGATPATSIAKWHLFGNTPNAEGGPGAPRTTLAMILRGTLADRDPAHGVAVIDDGDRGERAFRAGDPVSNGVKLARVYPDHVVLLHEGAEETLALTRDRNADPANIVRAPTANPRQRAGASADSSSPGAAQTVRAPADVQQTIERLRENPDEIARRVQIVPVIDGGRLSGVRVSAGADMALLGRIGLRAGDIVTAVNGAPVDSLARGQQIIESLRTASSLRVTVLRDGKPTDITVSLK